jgi:ribosomal protein L11 methyltransferase
MPWLALDVEVREAQAEALSDALLQAGAVSVSLEDAEAGSAAEQPLFAEPGWDSPAAWRCTRVSALLAIDTDAASLLAAAAAAAGIAPPRCRVRRVEDQDWVRATQSQFAPIAIGRRLWIVPSWHEPPADPRAIVIRLDPGLAFGTGSHATTRLVLEWLERVGCEDRRVLDYGCGSGILAIAAARLGAKTTDGVDVDGQALSAADANAARNAVAMRSFQPDELPPGDYDIVLANILANPLAVLAPLLTARTRLAGRIALSGILATQAEAVISAYAPHFALAVEADLEGWVLLAGLRR